MASLNKNRVKFILAERKAEKGFYDTFEKSGQKLKDLKSFHKLVTMVGLGHFEKKNLCQNFKNRTIFEK